MATPPGIVSMRYFLWVGELRRVKSTPRIGVTRKIGVGPFGCSAKAATEKSETTRMNWLFHIADNAGPSLFPGNLRMFRHRPREFARTAASAGRSSLI